MTDGDDADRDAPPGGGGDGDAPDGATAPDPDRKVRDMVAGADDALDPATITKLMSWFEMPSFAQVEAGEVTLGAPPAPSAADDDAHARREQRATALAAIEPWMIAMLERHTADADAWRARRPPPAGAAWVDVEVGRVDLGHLPEEIDPYDLPEVEVPQQLKRDLKICTPQASLRDLHRPDKDFFVHLQSPWDDEEDPWPLDPMAPVRATIRASYRVGPTFTHAIRAITSARAELLAIRARPWAEGKRERARKLEEEILAREAAEAGAAGKVDDAGSVVRGPEESP